VVPRSMPMIFEAIVFYLLGRPQYSPIWPVRGGRALLRQLAYRADVPEWQLRVDSLKAILRHEN
jgi:hypothetical protein